MPLVWKKCHFPCSLSLGYNLSCLKSIRSPPSCPLELLKPSSWVSIFWNVTVIFFMGLRSVSFLPCKYRTYCKSSDDILKTGGKKRNRKRMIRFCFERSGLSKRQNPSVIFPYLLPAQNFLIKTGTETLSKSWRISQCFLCTSIGNKQGVFAQNAVTLVLTLNNVSKIHSPLLNKYRNGILAWWINWAHHPEL